VVNIPLFREETFRRRVFGYQPSTAAVPRTFSDFLEGYLDTNPKVKYASPLIRVGTEN
jgi:hypothetical protein